jgi:hypothetical protein
MHDGKSAGLKLKARQAQRPGTKTKSLCFQGFLLLSRAESVSLHEKKMVFGFCSVELSWSENIYLK